MKRRWIKTKVGPSCIPAETGAPLPLLENFFVDALLCPAQVHHNNIIMYPASLFSAGLQTFPRSSLACFVGIWSEATDADICHHRSTYLHDLITAHRRA